MSKVFVLAPNKKPLNPVHSGQARRLLNQGKAAIFRRIPFSIILKKEVNNSANPLRVKIDPGAKTTGLSLVNDQTGEVIWAGELTHRGFAIRESLTSRRQLRRSRRGRKTRYRQPRFNNRKRVDKSLPPSLMSRVHNILTWVRKLTRLAIITAISSELVRFDTQALENPEIRGTEYQQGELAGYEVREYLLEKFNRKCIYCSQTDTRLEIEHLTPRSKGGSNRVSNLGIACQPCNQKKGNRDVLSFLKGKQDLAKKILDQAKKPLADTAAVNATRWELFNQLKQFNLPVEVGTGGLTKFNRCRQNLDKTHWLDAACVGQSTPEQLIIKGVRPLLIKANGHGTRQMCGTNKYGFPIRHRSRIKIHKGFQTGDIVKAIVTSGKKIGIHAGRVLCRASGSFDIASKSGRVTGISHKNCRVVHKNDGYAYEF
ncbi:RNA-guided endonuclease IscB [Gloeothece verrucosa]|uniref:HNH endonuclease n=1 Tax=Gloeothece verrucosa (strain PCC 7822) TaxID=497965 RepID=E0UH49_GLOV7|nr:RNA-guided endonuclease IscB [Gloeothece verrucosa]ADN15648.1 HNH endonuclease [Gloeothece verrucosa PCC 7822]